MTIFYVINQSSVHFPRNLTIDFPPPTSSSMKSKWAATPHDYLQVVLNLSLLICLLTEHPETAPTTAAKSALSKRQVEEKLVHSG